MATLGLTRVDPYKNFKFIVEVDGFDVAGFRSVKGLRQSTTDIKYREGGDNSTSRKLIGQTEFDDIVLEKGLTKNAAFYAWATAVFNVAGDVISEKLVKHFITIKVLDKTGKSVKVYQIFNCWPKEYSVGDLDAMGNDVLLESIALAHEGFVLTKSA